MLHSPSSLRRRIPILLGICVLGFAIRYCAFHFHTGYLSLGANAQALCQWDCGWYIGVASNGYQLHANPNGEANWAFFPLLPVLLGLLHALTALPLVVCGFLIGMACIGLAALLAVPLFEDDSRAYWIFCTLLLAGPLSFYYSTGLTEPLFVMLTVLLMVCLKRRAYLSAGATLALLSATRPTGILTAVMLLWRLLEDYRRDQLPVGRAALACLMAPAGLIAFMVYLHFHVDDALAFVHVQAAWHRSLDDPIARLTDAFDAGPSELPFWFAITAIGALVLSIVLARRGLIGEAVFCTAAIGLTVSSGLQSMPRIVAGLVPLTIILARMFSRPALLGVVITVMGLIIGYFATVKWISGFQFLV